MAEGEEIRILNDVEKLKQLSTTIMELYNAIEEKEKQIIAAINDFKQFVTMITGKPVIPMEEYNEIIKELKDKHKIIQTYLKEKAKIFRELKRLKANEKKIVGFLGGKANRLEMAIVKKEFRRAIKEMRIKMKMARSYARTRERLGV